MAFNPGQKTKFVMGTPYHTRINARYTAILSEHYDQKMWNSYVEPKDRPEQPEPVIFVW
jgi:hypothetical protein